MSVNWPYFSINATICVLSGIPSALCPASLSTFYFDSSTFHLLKWPHLDFVFGGMTGMVDSLQNSPPSETIKILI